MGRVAAGQTYHPSAIGAAPEALSHFPGPDLDWRSPAAWLSPFSVRGRLVEVSIEVSINVSPLRLSKCHKRNNHGVYCIFCPSRPCRFENASWPTAIGVSDTLTV